mmetsp:Transcript_15809/g.15997  ORF Transcript_15809/g.15997 Transcript_15809/m.15997 type:complete len:173 (-) Transcript_15809:371-889(-)
MLRSPSPYFQILFACLSLFALILQSTLSDAFSLNYQSHQSFRLSLLRRNTFEYSVDSISGTGFNNLARHKMIPSSAIILQSKEESSVDDSDPTGQKRGAYLFASIMLIVVWLFSVPPEFRRARFCTEEQYSTYRYCTTPKEWVNGVKDYYGNGGGVKFDFTVDPTINDPPSE